MSNFSVNATYYLRNAYAPNNRTLITEASRKKETNAKLSQADSNALKKAIRALEDYDYKKDESEVSSAEKTRFDKELRAFIDTYNYSMESSSKSSNRDIKNAGKNLEKLAQKYKDELEDIGIKIKDNGYLELSSTATSNLKLSAFGDMFSSSSSFLKEARTYAGNIARHVDTYI